MRRHAKRGVVILVAIVVIVGLGWAWDRSSQPSTGDGWRLLGRQRTIGAAGTATELLDSAQLDAAWAKALLKGRPVVDFATEAVVWVVAAGTRACPARLERVALDPVAGTVTASFSLGLTAGCDHAVVSDSFLIALDRRRIPAEPFQIRIVGP